MERASFSPGRSFLKSLLGTVLLLASGSSAIGQSKSRTGSAPQARKQPTQPRNPQIARIISEIDGRNIERTIRKLVSFGARNTLSEQNDPNRGIGAARDWLYGEFEKIAAASGGRLTIEKQAFEQAKAARVPQPTMLTNIIATLKGTQAESINRVYVVSGHYDSMCTSPTDAKCDALGANDDASGTAAVLELARVMSKYKIEATFTNDIIGSSIGGNGKRDAHTVRVFSEGVPSNETQQEAMTRRSVGGENDSASRQLARFIKESGERYVPGMKVWMIYRRDRYGRGGDHQPFLERGYAAVRFTEPNEDYHHQHQNVRVENGIQYGDLPQFDDFNYIADVARVNAASLAALALAPARPKTLMVNTGLSNDTELKWDANKEIDLAGYEIVWRDTTEPVWTHAQSIGNVNSYTMKGMSKDNYFFGVRAIDKEGNRSPVSYPRPMPRAPANRTTPASN